MSNDSESQIQDAERGAKAGPDAPSPFRGLSVKLIALSILFVMLGEVLIFVPSIAKFRVDWLQDRLAAFLHLNCQNLARSDGKFLSQ